MPPITRSSFALFLGLVALGAAGGLFGGVREAMGQCWTCNPWCPPANPHPIQLHGCFTEEVPPQDTPSTPGFVPLSANATWITSTITPDKQPIAVIQLVEIGQDRWEGVGGNPEGLKGEWRALCPGTFVPDEPIYLPGHDNPRQMEWLVEEMRQCVEDYGFRRIMLFCPAGNYFGRRFTAPGGTVYYDGQDIPINQWYGMPEWKRQAFRNALGAYQTFIGAHPSVKVELYMGSVLVDSACTLHAHALSELHEAVAQPGSTPFVQFMNVRLPNGSFGDRQRWLVPATQTTPEVAIDPRLTTHITRLYNIFAPWMRIGELAGSPGITRFWLDAGVDQYCPGGDLRRRRWGLHELAANPWLRMNHVRIGGENIPTTDDDGLDLDETAIHQVPYMALDSWLLENRPSPQDPNVHHPRWDYFGTLPVTTGPQGQLIGHEVHCLVSDHNLMTWDRIDQARRRGYILSPVNVPEAHKAYKMRLIQRWYSMGKIYIADFNGDGVVDGTDVDDFQAVYARYRDDAPAPGPDRPFTVYATCDLNQDGKVDLDDWNMFHEAWDAAPSYPNAMGPLVDYFDANV